DSLGYQGQVEAATVLFQTGYCPRVLQFYLGTEEEHTVFKEKAVGLMLSTELIATENDPTFPISILINN
ncbi:hypothetical protein BDR06DRAFT_884974, partial [Suillus hirtellus]